MTVPTVPTLLRFRGLEQRRACTRRSEVETVVDLWFQFVALTRRPHWRGVTASAEVTGLETGNFWVEESRRRGPRGKWWRRL